MLDLFSGVSVCRKLALTDLSKTLTTAACRGCACVAGNETYVTRNCNVFSQAKIWFSGTSGEPTSTELDIYVELDWRVSNI